MNVVTTSQNVRGYIEAQLQGADGERRHDRIQKQRLRELGLPASGNHSFGAAPRVPPVQLEHSQEVFPCGPTATSPLLITKGGRELLRSASPSAAVPYSDKVIRQELALLEMQLRTEAAARRQARAAKAAELGAYVPAAGALSAIATGHNSRSQAVTRDAATIAAATPEPASISVGQTGAAEADKEETRRRSLAVEEAIQERLQTFERQLRAETTAARRSSTARPSATAAPAAVLASQPEIQDHDELLEARAPPDSEGDDRDKRHGAMEPRQLYQKKSSKAKVKLSKDEVAAVRQRVKAIENRRADAAVHIQSMVRGMLARRLITGRMERLREEQERRFQGEQLERQRKAEARAARLKEDALVRDRAFQFMERRNKAALTLQRFARGLQSKRLFITMLKGRDEGEAYRKRQRAMKEEFLKKQEEIAEQRKAEMKEAELDELRRQLESKASSSKQTALERPAETVRRPAYEGPLIESEGEEEAVQEAEPQDQSERPPRQKPVLSRQLRQQARAKNAPMEPPQRERKDSLWTALAKFVADGRLQQPESSLSAAGRGSPRSRRKLSPQHAALDSPASVPSQQKVHGYCVQCGAAACGGYFCGDCGMPLRGTTDVADGSMSPPPPLQAAKRLPANRHGFHFHAQPASIYPGEDSERTETSSESSGQHMPALADRSDMQRRGEKAAASAKRKATRHAAKWQRRRGVLAQKIDSWRVELRAWELELSSGDLGPQPEMTNEAEHLLRQLEFSLDDRLCGRCDIKVLCLEALLRSLQSLCELLLPSEDGCHPPEAGLLLAGLAAALAGSSGITPQLSTLAAHLRDVGVT
eukprot:TRINITY_DN28696_c0_g1_i1.p1 TRINITY_DN28696_c0_g1~~TRINITY_DN28696_c0_g1_i1.p1  ORF type:complete len:821 (-),score=187.90 TRINITY_DN28696_c0_g1_i1:712-3174(-)